MKYTYDIKSREGAVLVVAYRADVPVSPVIEKTLVVPAADKELLTIVENAPIVEWATANPSLFPAKPPGTPSEFKVDTTQQPPQGAPV